MRLVDANNGFDPSMLSSHPLWFDADNGFNPSWENELATLHQILI